MTITMMSGVNVQYAAFVSSVSAAQYDDPQVFRPERWLRGHECQHQVSVT